MPYTLVLLPEPTNKYDKYAIKIMVEQIADRNTHKYIEKIPIGYVPKKLSKNIGVLLSKIKNIVIFWIYVGLEIWP